MSEPSSTEVVILGAGLTGMACAYHLRKAGMDCRLLEKSAQPGGHASTLEDRGYRFDRTGHLLHLRDPETRALCLSWIDGQVLEIKRRSRVWSHGCYTRYPFQANTYGLPPAVAYECVQGFVDAHIAKLNTGAPPARHFEEFCLQHFGEGISRHFMIPYNEKLWGVSGQEITAAWCDRFVPIPKLQDVIAGAFGASARELGYNATFLYPYEGIGALPLGLSRAAGPIEFQVAPTAIDWRKRTLALTSGAAAYRRLISTMPLKSLVELLIDAPREVREAGAKLRCTHLYYLDVALNTRVDQDFHWVYVPESKYPFYRVGCYSNFSSRMAPPGKANLYVELAGRSAPDPKSIAATVAAHLVEMKVIRSPDAVRFAHVRRLDNAYVIFDHNYFEALAIIQPFLTENDIISTGRYGGWNYSSMEDALHFGRDAAASIIRTGLS